MFKKFSTLVFVIAIALMGVGTLVFSMSGTHSALAASRCDAVLSGASYCIPLDNREKVVGTAAASGFIPGTYRMSGVAGSGVYLTWVSLTDTLVMTTGLPVLSISAENLGYATLPTTSEIEMVNAVYGWNLDINAIPNPENFDTTFSARSITITPVYTYSVYPSQSFPIWVGGGCDSCLWGIHE